MANCTGSLPNGGQLDTTTSGTHTFTVTATDNAGNETVVTNSYTVGPFAEPISFTIDAGATFTPTEPTSSAPVTTLPTETLTGSYTIERQPSSPYFGSDLFKVTAFHMTSSSGAVFDLASTGQLICWGLYGNCEPQVTLNVTGFPTATYAILQTTGLAIGRPTWEGPLTDPTGYNWRPPNTYVPTGVSLYRSGPTGSLQIIGVVAFHASRGVPDSTPPQINIAAPADGAAYSLGQVKNASIHVHGPRWFRCRVVRRTGGLGHRARHDDRRLPRLHRHRDRHRGEHLDRDGHLRGAAGATEHDRQRR